MTDRRPAVDAVRELLRLDAGFAGSPDRLARALRDLLPHDDRAVHLLSTAARLGVPALVTSGAAGDARHRLVDLGGLRPESAGWVVDVWCAALDPRSVAGPAPPWHSLPAAGSAVDPGTDADGPTAATAVDVATLPDGAAVVAVLTPDGVFATMVSARASGTTPVRWRRVATPSAPNSRDVAVCAVGGTAMIAWTDTGALSVRGARPDPSVPLALTEPRLIALGAEVEPRFPLAVYAADETTVDLIWTADRRRLGRRTVREWLSAAEPADLPSPVGPGERLSRLDAAATADGGAYLVALTDRGRLLVARAHGDVVSAWAPVATPSLVTGVTVTAVGGEPVIVAATGGGYLYADPAPALAGAARWRPVARVGRRSEPAKDLLVAGSASAAGSWLAVCAGTSGWLHRVGRRDEGPVAGPELPLWASTI